MMPARWNRATVLSRSRTSTTCASDAARCAGGGADAWMFLRALRLTSLGAHGEPLNPISSAVGGRDGNSEFPEWNSEFRSAWLPSRLSACAGSLAAPAILKPLHHARFF